MRKLDAICWTLALLAAVAFAKKYPLTAASAVPGARGDVDISKDNNGDTKLKMKVQRLANAENLTPPAAGYVIGCRHAVERRESGPTEGGRRTWRPPSKPSLR